SGLAQFALFASVAACSAVLAQQQDTRTRRPEARQDANRPTTEQTLTVPASQEVLQVNVVSPEEVSVGSSYQLRITLRNTSDSTVLHDVRLATESVGSVDVQARSSQRDQQQGQSQQQGQQQQQQDRQQQDGQQQDRQQQDREQQD